MLPRHRFLKHMHPKYQPRGAARSKLFAAAAVFVALSAAGAAQAADYELKFTGTNVSGDVFATTTDANVTAISGWVTDSEVGAGPFTITGLSAYAAADNAFSATWPYVDFSGLSFTTLSGGDYNLANIGSAESPEWALLSSVLNPGGGVQSVGLTDIALSVATVPEPPVVGLMAGALALFGLARRHRAARDAD